MTVHDTHEAVATPVIPVPRATEELTVPAQVSAPEQATTAPVTTPERVPVRGEFPWPEPWHFSLGARPRSDYWDVETATWRSQGPIPSPRRR